MVLLGMTPAILLVIGYALACVGVGLALMRALGLRPWTAVEGMGGSAGLVSVAFAAGLGLLGALLTVLALAGQFTVVPLGIVAGLACVVAGASLAQGDLRMLFPRLKAAWTGLHGHERVLAAAMLAAFLLLGLRSLGPFALAGDAVAYYLVVAKEVALTGKLGLSWFNYLPIFSFGVEAHYAFLYKFGGETAVTLFGWVMAGGLLLAVAGLAKVNGYGRDVALLAMLFILSMEAFVIDVGNGKADIPGALFGVSAIALVLGGVVHRLPRGAFLLAGLLAGFAVTAKLSNALVAPVLAVALVAFWMQRSAPRRQLLQSAAVVGAGMLAALSVHFLKSWMMLREPLIPFLTLGPLLTGIAESPEAPYWAGGMTNVVGYIAEQRTLSNLDLVFLPVTWSFLVRPWMGGNLSPLFLAIIPLGLWVAGTPRGRLLWMMAATAIAAWFAISPFTVQTRYHLIGLSILAVPAAYIAAELWKRVTTRRAVSVALGLALLITLVHARRAAYAVPYLTGALTRAEYLRERAWFQPFFDVAEAVNAARGNSERTYLVRSAFYYNYFFDDATLLAAQSAEEATQVWTLNWNAKAWPYIYGRGFRWVMISKQPEAIRGELHESQVENLPAAYVLETVYEDKDVRVARVALAEAALR